MTNSQNLVFEEFHLQKKSKKQLIPKDLVKKIKPREIESVLMSLLLVRFQRTSVK